MADFDNLDAIEDEDALESMINQTEDLELRRKIRRRQKNIREKRHAQWEAERRARLESAGGSEDAVSMRLRRAEEDKQRKMREFEEKARSRSDEIGAGEAALRERHANADLAKQQTLEQLHEMNRAKTAAYNQGVHDFLKEKKDLESGSTPGTGIQNADVGAPEVKRTASLQQRGHGGTAYVAKPNTQDSQKTSRPPIERNPSAIKQMLLDWCKAQCEGYQNVNVTNFSTSWADGLAFCALIHHFYPNAFDFSQLNPKKRRENFTLAFETAEKMADISPLLDVEDMVRMKSPDWKCVFTYVQLFYRRFAMQPKQNSSATVQMEVNSAPSGGGGGGGDGEE